MLVNLILHLLLHPAAPSTYSCDDTVNFIHGVTYHQISLTDGCSSDGCNKNPVYVPTYATAPSDGVQGNTADGAVSYCQSRCDSPTLFHEFSHLGDPNAACSICTGFFFQRHTNGHEICGFYTLDLNDKTLDKVGHGHSPGSRICTKTKLSINTTTTLLDHTSAVRRVLDRATGFRSCGANNIVIGPIINDDETSNGNVPERRLTFRFDVADGPAGLDANQMSERFLVAMTPAPTNDDGDRRRRRLESSSSSCVRTLGTCLSHVCGSGWTYLAQPKVYCDGGLCREEECCSCTAIASSGECTSSTANSDGSSTTSSFIGRCVSSEAATSLMVAVYDACKNKAEGEGCQLCDPQDMDCAESMVIKQCQSGTCRTTEEVTTTTTTEETTESTTEETTEEVINANTAEDDKDTTPSSSTNAKTSVESRKSRVPSSSSRGKISNDTIISVAEDVDLGLAGVGRSIAPWWWWCGIVATVIWRTL